MLNLVFSTSRQLDLCHLERLANRVLMPKKSLVKLLCKEYCRIINNGVALLDTDDVIDAGTVENLASKLAMASRYEDEFER